MLTSPTGRRCPTSAPVTESHGLIKTKPAEGGFVVGVVEGLIRGIRSAGRNRNWLRLEAVEDELVTVLPSLDVEVDPGVRSTTTCSGS